MNGEDESYGSNRSKERADLVIIFVVASLSLTALLVALSYYCYISNKLSKRRSLSHHQTPSQLSSIVSFLCVCVFNYFLRIFVCIKINFAFRDK